MRIIAPNPQNGMKDIGCPSPPFLYSPFSRLALLLSFNSNSLFSVPFSFASLSWRYLHEHVLSYNRTLEKSNLSIIA
jgi:hypothetical protein